MQSPVLRLHVGDEMSADEAGWSMVADAAAAALKLPGLSPASRGDLFEVWAGSRMAAGLSCEPPCEMPPSESLRQLGGVQLQA